MRWNPGGPAEIVAEIGANHGASADSVRGLIKAAAGAGATAVKVQLYTPDSLTIDASGPAFTVAREPWQGRNLYDLYRDGQLPRELLPAIATACFERELDLIASVYSLADVEFAMRSGIGWAALKIASFENNDPGLIRCAAATGLPLIISTGMASTNEIERAVEAAKRAPHLTLLHCISAYPAALHSADLFAIPRLLRFADLAMEKVSVGYSDHTANPLVPALAVALGATMIEAHIGPEVFFTTAEYAKDEIGKYLDRNFSFTPFSFADMVRNVRQAEAATTRGGTWATEFSELRRSLWVVADVKPGETFTHGNVRSIRPAGGMEPRLLGQVVGKTATRALGRATPLTSGDVDGLDAEGPAVKGGPPATYASDGW